ncbi:MAG: glycoside hydrolase family 32 protein [Actinomycetota bacterium]|nr:glycoside hydrolase family 32 protein [Actinomycetota bacterium]
MTGRAVRPRYHFAPRAGWINDPLGVTFRREAFDVFFQYVPDGTTWRPDCQWGHAVSTDLMGFAEEAAALVPGDGDAGCWSGCVVAGHDLIFFTSVAPADLSTGRVRTARALDATWHEWAKGPYVVEVPPGTAVSAFRDPFVWWDDDRWRMLVGAALPGGTAAALTFTSPDLAHWTYDGVFAERSSRERDGAWTGSLWECPQLVRVDGEDVLIVSVWDDDELHHVACARGVSGSGRFAAGTWQQLTFGAFYAATAFRDDEGQPALLQWLRGVGDPVAGWCGALSVPQRLSVRDGRVLAMPHPRVAGARGRPVMCGQAVDEPVALPSWHCELGLAPAAAVHAARLTCGGERDGTHPAVTLDLDWTGGEFRLAARGARPDVCGPLDPGREGITVLLDGCLAEVYLGRSGVAAAPIQQQRAEPAWMHVSRGVRVDVWELNQPR